jgi:hypothetical protein
MANAVWPAELPEYPLVQGYTRKPQAARVRSAVDAGPAKVRRRFTAKVRNVTYLVTLTKAQLAIFWDFYDNTLAEGSLPFNWVDGVTGAPAVLRFADDEPSEAPANGNEPGYLTISMPLEILPS